MSYPSFVPLLQGTRPTIIPSLLIGAGGVSKKKKGRYIPRLRGTSSFETRHGASRSQMPSGRQRSLTSPPVDHLLEAHAHILGDLETHAGNDAFPQLPASPLMYRSLTSDGDREIELRDGGEEVQGLIDNCGRGKKSLLMAAQNCAEWRPSTTSLQGTGSDAD